MKKSKKIIALAIGIVLIFTVAIIAIKSSKGKDNDTGVTETTQNETESTSVEETVFIDETDFTQEETTEDMTSHTENAEKHTDATKSTTAKKSVSKNSVKTTVRNTSTTKKQTTTKRSTTKSSTTKQATTKSVTTKQVTTKPTTNIGKYSCGIKNHSCSTIQEHEFLCELEAKGCPICGSHSCISFYAKDEWGHWCYDLTKCPQYTKKKDPLEYCEHCGKKIGLGDDGTCVRFTVDTECPICGKLVKAKTCHTH